MNCSNIKRTFYISVIILGFTISPVNPLSPAINIEQTCAATPTIPAKYQTAILNIKNNQTETGSIVSEHINIKNGHTTANRPKLYFLVKNEIAGSIIYGGEIKKFFKTIFI